MDRNCPSQRKWSRINQTIITISFDRLEDLDEDDLGAEHLGIVTLVCELITGAHKILAGARKKSLLEVLIGSFGLFIDH